MIQSSPRHVNLKSWSFYAGCENLWINFVNAAFLHNQHNCMSRCDKWKDCIVYREYQLALFIKTSSFGTICEEPSLMWDGYIGLNFDCLNKSVGTWGFRCD